MIFYFNGDSFVSGVELADHLLPNHPGYIKFDDQIKKNEAKKWIKKTYDSSHEYGKLRHLKYKEIADTEFESCFPNILSKKYGINIINRALGGSSNDRIIRTTLNDLIKLLEHKEEVTAIIGTTSINRFEIPNYEDSWYADYHGEIKVWNCISGHYHMDNRELAQPLIEYHIKYEKNYHQLVRFYKEVILLQSFCQSNNIKLYWLETLENISKIQVENNYKNIEDLINFKKQANFKYTFSMYEIVEKNKHEEVLCPSGHYSPLIHNLIADEIYNFIKEGN